MSAARTLVVDDEPMLRHLVRRILEPQICGVMEVEDGETALRLIQRRGDSIDVVLTDIAMPGIDGFIMVDAASADRTGGGHGGGPRGRGEEASDGAREGTRPGLDWARSRTWRNWQTRRT
jgi:CheY-like chemotaxis protein